jgi:hypothetical protein
VLQGLTLYDSPVIHFVQAILSGLIRGGGGVEIFGAIQIISVNQWPKPSRSTSSMKADPEAELADSSCVFVIRFAV